MEHVLKKVISKAAVIYQQIPSGESLADRVRLAMRYVRDHDQELFGLKGVIPDEFKFQVAVTAASLASNAEDNLILQQSIEGMMAWYDAHRANRCLDDLQDTITLPLVDWWIESGKRKPCVRCHGEGEIADTKDGEPWSAWKSLPPGSDVAVRLGWVKPIPCPICNGKGTNEL